MESIFKKSAAQKNYPSVDAKPFFQPKLAINQPHDVYEQEADAMADKVMRMEQPGIQLKPLPITSVQRKCAHCEEEEKKMQRKEMNTEEAAAGNNLENYVGGLSSGGQSLPNEVKNFYEPRFGYDFSNVKVHTDDGAARSAQSINALAYTNGNNIVFNSGQYAPGTGAGKKLLAHELTHVVQQSSGVIRRYGHDSNCDETKYLRPFIWPGHWKALRMLENVIAALKTGDPKLTTWVPAFFGSDGPKHLSEIQSNYESIQTAVNEEYMYHCNDSSNANDNSNVKQCHGQRAETDLDSHLWGGGNKDITLCFDVIKSGWSITDVGALIIHENYHRAFGGSAHPWSVRGNPPDCFGSGPPAGSVLLLDNPDSYACLASVFA